MPCFCECLCLWRSIFKALKKGPVLPASTRKCAGGIERHTPASWLSGNLHISFLAPKRIRFNSGPLSHCHRHKTAINNKKSHTVGIGLGRRKPLIISYLQAGPPRDGSSLSPTTNFCLVKLTFAVLLSKINARLGCYDGRNWGFHRAFSWRKAKRCGKTNDFNK